MKNRYLATLFVLLQSALWCSTEKPYEQLETFIENTYGVTHLSQADFESGTYRIQSGGYYILDEDISFNPDPNSDRPDMPTSGWFAAITIETSDGVVIDLNQKSLVESRTFLDTNIFTVFADIELDNSPFCGIFYGTLGTYFPGDSSFVSASNVIIKNGTLGCASHWGVHGNINRNLYVDNVLIKDFEVSAIETNALIDASFTNIEISGLEHTIEIPPLRVVADVAADVLEQYVSAPDPVGPKAQELLDNLNLFIATDPECNTPLTNVPGSMYAGIVMASGFTTLSPFPLSSEDCEYTAQVLSDGNTVQNIVFENIYIHDLVHEPKDVTYIGSTEPTPPPLGFLMGNMVGIDLIGFLGGMRWEDAFDSQGNFAPNALSQAMAFGALQLIATTPMLATFLPPNFPDIADSIINPDESKFLANVQPQFGRDILSHTMKGTFAMRIDCCDSIKVKNCKIKNVHNIGGPGVELSEIPDGSYFEGTLSQSRYGGADIWGFEFATANNVDVKECQTSHITSLNGDVFGLDLINEVSNTTVSHCLFKHEHGHGDNTESSVNPPSEVYGMRVQNNFGPVSIKKCHSRHLHAPRFVFGFSGEESIGVTMDRCEVRKIDATSSKDLMSAPKQAFAFDLENANTTTLILPSAKDIEIRGEKRGKKSDSTAACIYIDSESLYNTVVCPTCKHIEAKAGTHMDIDNLGHNTKVSLKKCPRAR